MDEKFVQSNISFTRDLRDKLRQTALIEKTSMADVVRRACEKYLREKEAPLVQEPLPEPTLSGTVRRALTTLKQSYGSFLNK